MRKDFSPDLIEYIIVYIIYNIFNSLKLLTTLEKRDKRSLHLLCPSIIFIQFKYDLDVYTLE